MNFKLVCPDCKYSYRIESPCYVVVCPFCKYPVYMQVRKVDIKYPTQINCHVANLAQTDDLFMIGISAASWELHQRITSRPAISNRAKKYAEVLRLREKELLAPGQEPYQFLRAYKHNV